LISCKAVRPQCTWCYNTQWACNLTASLFEWWGWLTRWWLWWLRRCGNHYSLLVLFLH
jgi:hypothetical protein